MQVLSLPTPTPPVSPQVDHALTFSSLTSSGSRLALKLGLNENRVRKPPVGCKCQKTNHSLVEEQSTPAIYKPPCTHHCTALTASLGTGPVLPWEPACLNKLRRAGWKSKLAGKGDQDTVNLNLRNGGKGTSFLIIIFYSLSPMVSLQFNFQGFRWVLMLSPTRQQL